VSSPRRAWKFLACVTPAEEAQCHRAAPALKFGVWSFFGAWDLELGSSQYSLFLIPGIGAGYFPSLSACTGAAEAIVHVSIPAAISWSEFSASS
jgi:hypothetical protein